MVSRLLVLLMVLAGRAVAPGFKDWRKMPLGKVRLVSCCLGVRVLSYTAETGTRLTMESLKNPSDDTFSEWLIEPIGMGDVTIRAAKLDPPCYLREREDRKNYFFAEHLVECTVLPREQRYRAAWHWVEEREGWFALKRSLSIDRYLSGHRGDALAITMPNKGACELWYPIPW